MINLIYQMRGGEIMNEVKYQISCTILDIVAFSSIILSFALLIRIL